MTLLVIIGKSAALIVGALLIATLFCWLCWSAFKLVRHPEIGVPLCLAGLILAWGSTFTSSTFLCVVVVDAALGAAVLWPLGLAWRRRLNDCRKGADAEGLPDTNRHGRWHSHHLPGWW